MLAHAPRRGCQPTRRSRRCAGCSPREILVVDGGNSDFRDAPGHATRLGGLGVSFCDVGVSGGRWDGRPVTDDGRRVRAPTSSDRAGAAVRSPLRAAAHMSARSVSGIWSRHPQCIQYAIMQSYAEGTRSQCDTRQLMRSPQCVFTERMFHPVVPARADGRGAPAESGIARRAQRGCRLRNGSLDCRGGASASQCPRRR